MVRTLLASMRRLVAIALLVASSTAIPVRAADNIVRAVLFYSTNCSHCHYVITEVLPPLMEKHGSSLKIIGIDISTSGGNALYEAAVREYEITDDRYGVPCLIIGDHDLVGDLEIPERLPTLIDEYLASGGVDWPAIPGLAEALAARAPTATPAATPTEEQSARTRTSSADPLPTTAPVTKPTVAEKLARDPVGNALAVIVLLALIVSVSRAMFALANPPTAPDALWRRWTILGLAIAGVCIAGYLAFVETTRTTAVCGPVGDCNSVQQSGFALLFGLLPIGVFGVAGYIAIILAWLVRARQAGTLAALADAALFSMALFGVCFSAYLTFLEPFVIGATCAWCLGSAVVMLGILTLSSGPGARAVASLRTPSHGTSSQAPK